MNLFLFFKKIESFDPFNTPPHFSSRVAANPDKVTVKIQDNWNFNRMGIVGDIKSVKNERTIGWLATLEQILNYTNLNNQVIDVFKMDVENSEWGLFLNLDIDYFCKYVKQFVLETHTQEVNPKVVFPKFNPLEQLRKLEKCFSLFHRDTRFYKELKVSPYGFFKTEFQEPKTYMLNISEYNNERELIDFMVTYGELYFLNFKIQNRQKFCLINYKIK